MTRVFIFHIDFTFTKLLWLQKMADNIGKNRENAILDHNMEVLKTIFLKSGYQHS